MVLQLPVVRTDFTPAPTGRGALGWPTGIRCPRCLQREIVYNGNYFCSGYGDIFGPGNHEQECGWALPRPDDMDCDPHHRDLQAALIESMTKRGS